MQGHNVDKNLKDRIMKHYKYQWTKTKGIKLDTLFDGLTPSLHTDIARELFKGLFEEVIIIIS